MKLKFSVTALAAFVLFTSGAHAQSWTVNWKASVAGITIGTMQSNLSLKDESYAIDGSVRTAGLAAAFAKFRGTVAVKGSRRKDGRIVPSSYFADQTRKNEREQISMRYKGGDIVGVSHEPEKVRSPVRLPITSQSLEGARDPASGLFVTMPRNMKDDLPGVCGRTIRLFDGNEVYDLRLSLEAAGGPGVSGVSGPTVTCKVRYLPIAGHDPNDRSIERLKNNDTLRITFARLDDSNAYVASRLSFR
ncbi:MAG: DUF3108 domain-containing protein, partial [Pseudomonadota bacterium]